MASPVPRRVRLRPWLVAQVDSGRFPGLHWLDARRRLFVIPWHHATRHFPAHGGDDETVFKAWAAETGKFLAGRDEPDPAKWKATLRCALNKSREFRLRYDGTRAVPPRPYKVYEVCGADGADTVTGDDFSCGGEEEEEEEDVSELQKLMSLSIDDCGMDPVPPWHEEHPPFSNADPTVPVLPPELPPELTSQLPPELNPQLTQQLPPQLPPPGPPALLEHGVPNLLASPHLLPLTDLELRFQYRGRRVSALTVSHPLGCRLSHGGSLPPTPQRPDLLGHPELQQVPFPDPEGIPHDKQRRYTRTLLGAMERGLLLELGGQDLYATRLCRCKVFWDGPCAPPQDPHLDPRPNPMERERRVQVFSLQRFLDGLILFQKGQSPTPPPFEVFLCFGEEWPDHRPKEKKLITVQVVPVAARLLLELFSGELSWSADSVPLQISQPDLKDALVEQFKELHRLWQQQQRPDPGPRPPL
ncbi:interferon regulatory factor 5 [Tympanuchus pallidicinctus]|uniref:interferon regulatory factor 5 n=1 Tax=Tympanuchus pallidicinctus TaxID=109042 RepID=UPI0022872D4E|nr:interferon regulatory factor 5 [Tympanuchus pallidicinctus]